MLRILEPLSAFANKKSFDFKTNDNSSRIPVKNSDGNKILKAYLDHVSFLGPPEHRLSVLSTNQNAQLGNATL